MRIFSIIFASTLVLAGCRQDSKVTHNEGIEHHQFHDEGGLLLDNGKKWQANAETTAGIQIMQERIANFSGNDADAAALGTALLGDYQTIFDKCTMTGNAHVMLHKYLLPLKPHLDELEACKSSCAEHVVHVKEYLDNYSTYFE